MINEFISQERRFVLRDWEPATLDGGQFAECAARIVYHQDSGNLSTRKGVADCLAYVEDPTNQNSHAFPQRRSALHVAKVIRTIYKLRSQRGAVHIDPDYTANQLDAKLVIEAVRWVFAEILRLFWRGDRGEVASAIRTLVQFEVPVVGIYEDILLVQRPDCTAEEEVLILLHHAGEAGLSRGDLSRYVRKSPAAISNACSRLCAPSCREIVKLPTGRYRLTDLGVRHVIAELANKLMLPH